MNGEGRQPLLATAVTNGADGGEDNGGVRKPLLVTSVTNEERGDGGRPGRQPQFVTAVINRADVSGVGRGYATAVCHSCVKYGRGRRGRTERGNAVCHTCDK